MSVTFTLARLAYNDDGELIHVGYLPDRATAEQADAVQAIMPLAPRIYAALT